MGRVMNKRQDYMEKMLALLLLVYAVGVLVGETLRDALYGQPVAHPPSADASASQPQGNKWRRYSGLFVLLKQKWHVSPPRWRAILNAAWTTFLAIVHSPVPT